MNSILKTKQSDFPWHFLKTVNWFSFKRWLLLWASAKCQLIAEYLCSAMRWWSCWGWVPDIICITQITWEMINNALLTDNWRLDFFGFKILPQFLAHKNRLQCGENLWLLLNPISGCLIFEWKTNSFCASTNQEISRRTPYMTNFLCNYYCSFLTVKLFIAHCYFGIYRLKLTNIFFDLLIMFSQCWNIIFF